MRIDFKRAILAGLVGTVVFDLLGFLGSGGWSTPEMLGSNLGVGLVGGVPVHYANGAILAIIYAGLAPSLWGPAWVRALTYTTAFTVFGVWLFMLPMMGAGVAGIGMHPLTPVMTLVGHWAYGLALAFLYPLPRAVAAEQPAPQAA